jgi:hypothetical protein
VWHAKCGVPCKYKNVDPGCGGGWGWGVTGDTVRLTPRRNLKLWERKACIRNCAKRKLQGGDCGKRKACIRKCVMKKLDGCNCGKGKRASVIVRRESFKLTVVGKEKRAFVNV